MIRDKLIFVIEGLISCRSAGLSTVFFSFFYFINRGRQLVRLGKSLIYQDLLGEADGRARLGKLFLTASKKKSVVVI